MLNSPESVEIKIEEVELKAAISQYLSEQKQIYKGAAKVQDLGQAQQSYTVEALPSEVGQRTWFDAEHVDGYIQCLIDERDYLKDTAAVFPTYNEDAISQVAQNLAYEKIKKNPAFLPLLPNNEPLVPERSKRDEAGQKAFDDEIKDRTNKEAHLRRIAGERLVENKFTKENLLICFFESLAIDIKQKQQIIIPFRVNNNHYTVAVVQLVNQNAVVKYYNSKNNDLSSHLKEQLIAFFVKQGYQTEYQNVSAYEQIGEVHNCAIFASLKSIDICNSNAGRPQRLLDGLTATNYDQFFICQRYKMAYKLNQAGYNLQLLDEVLKALKDIPAESVNELRDILINCLKELNEVYFKIAGESNNQYVSEPSDPVGAILQKCDHLKDSLIAKVENSQSEQHQELLKTSLESFNNIRIYLEEQIKELAQEPKIEPIRENLASATPVAENQGGSWKKILMLGSMLVMGSYFGLPLIVPQLSKIAVILPINPILLTILMVFAFVVCLELVNFAGSYIKGPKKQIPQSGYDTDSEQHFEPVYGPNFTPNFNRKDNQVRASDENGDSVVLKNDVKSSNGNVGPKI